MATRPNQSILNGTRVLAALAETPLKLRTVAALAKACPPLTEDQIEGALLAFEQAGAVVRLDVEGSPALYRLGAFHLELSLVELNVRLTNVPELVELLKRFDQLNNLSKLLKELNNV